MGLLNRVFKKSERLTKEEQSKVKQPNGGKPPREEQGQKIVPRIKADYSHEMYEADGSDAKFKGSSMPEGFVMPEGQKPHFIKLWGDLMVCFAIDAGNSYELINKDTVASNDSLTDDSLLQMGLQNMIAESGSQIKMQGDPNDIVMVTAGGNFEAALLLVEDFWNQVHANFEGDLLISVPARDLLFVSKASNSDSLQKHKELINNSFNNEQTHGLLSKGIFKREMSSGNLSLIDQGF